MYDEDDEEDTAQEGAPAWMATFSDMATLLLTFFVLLLSFAKMDEHNFKKAMGSIKEAMGTTFVVNGEHEVLSTSPIELSDRPSSDLLEQVIPEDRALQELRRIIEQADLEDSVEVSGTPRGLVVRIKDAILFDTGQDVIKDEGKPSLDIIVDMYEKTGGELAIEGHTDNVPISSSRFPSNWELSSARATAVLRYLSDEKGLVAKHMHIAGYADQRPIVPHDTEAHRARNRRVEFVFEHDPPQR